MAAKKACIRFEASWKREDVEYLPGGGAVVKNCKVNANRSKNKVFYSDPVLEAATPLYEGAQVYFDHEDLGAAMFGWGPRSTLRLAGQIRNLKFAPNGHRCDFYILPSVAGTAENYGLAADIAFAPGIMGFSHVVYCETADKLDDEGYEHVTKITSVESVDLVTKPATTRGMFESVRPETPKAENKENTVMDPKDKLIETLTADNERLKGEIKTATTSGDKARAEGEGHKAGLDALKSENKDLKEKLSKLEGDARVLQVEKACDGLPKSVKDRLKESTKKLSLEDAIETIKSVKESLSTGNAEPPKAPVSEGKTEAAATGTAPTGPISEAAFEKAFA